jgi:mediator of RNA polymerase II transcription subunit 16, fungi type
VASISPDGLRIHLRHLFCRPSDGKWLLSDECTAYTIPESATQTAAAPTAAPAVAAPPPPPPLVHLQWSDSGGELAAVDAAGRLAVLALSLALNTLVLQRTPTLDAPDDAAQLVALLWLNTQPQPPVRLQLLHLHPFI